MNRGTRGTRRTRWRVAALALFGAVGITAVALRRHDRTAVSTSAKTAPSTAFTASPAPTQPMAKRLTNKAAIGELRTAINAARQQREAAQPQPLPLRPEAAGDLAQSPASGAPPPINANYVRRAVKDVLPLVAECYDRALERDPKLAGTVVVKFSIVGEPNVGGMIGDSAIDAEKTTIADAQMRECMQETMHAIQIDPPDHGGEVEVVYPFTFAP